jgi:hypothetical protein
MPDDYEVHPFAASFPMMSEDELIELAADITKNGLRHPLMLDNAGRQLLDGRNRKRACAIAKVEPRYDQLPEGVDPIAYIISVNIERRHLNEGQRAIMLAMAYPERGKGGRGKLSQIYEGLTPAERASAQNRMSHAREIVAHADLAKRVMAKTLSLDHALKEARWLIANAKLEAQHQRRLEFDAPDLAEQVASGELSLYQAMQQHAARQAKASADRRKEREAWVSALRVVVAGWKNGMRADDTARALAAHALGIDPGRIKTDLDGLDGLASDATTA